MARQELLSWSNIQTFLSLAYLLVLGQEVGKGYSTISTLSVPEYVSIDRMKV